MHTEVTTITHYMSTDSALMIIRDDLYEPLNEVCGSILFCRVRRPFVHSSGGRRVKIFYHNVIFYVARKI